jgi:hypothetical protein
MRAKGAIAVTWLGDDSMRLTDSWLWGIWGALPVAAASRRVTLGLVLALTIACCAVGLPQPLQAQTPGPKFTKDADGWWVVASRGDVNGAGGAVSRLSNDNFWPDVVRQSPRGFLTTADGAPILVLPFGYTTPLFDGPDARFPGGVVDVMKPFRAYYIISRRPKNGPPLVVEVAEPPFSLRSSTYWVRLSDCFVWATGMAAELRPSTPVYATQENARAARQPMEPNAKHIEVGRNPGITAVGPPPPQSRLPVLMRAADVASLVCPAYGGELCWVNLSSSDGGVVIYREQ